MAEIKLVPDEVAAEVARVIGVDLAAPLLLKTCTVGSLVRLPAPDKFDDALNAVFVRVQRWRVEDPEDDASLPWLRAVYQLAVLYLRLQRVQGEDHEQAALRDAARVSALFLNAQRRLPGLKVPGVRVVRVVPREGTLDNEFNETLDCPELRTNAATMEIEVHTRMVPA